MIMAAPIPAVPGKEQWGDLVGEELNGALDIIRQERPDITIELELDIADGCHLHHQKELYVLLSTTRSSPTRTVYMSMILRFLTRLRILARLHSKCYLYTFLCLDI